MVQSVCGRCRQVLLFRHLAMPARGVVGTRMTVHRWVRRCRSGHRRRRRCRLRGRRLRLLGPAGRNRPVIWSTRVYRLVCLGTRSGAIWLRPGRRADCQRGNHRNAAQEMLHAFDPLLQFRIGKDVIDSHSTLRHRYPARMTTCDTPFRSPEHTILQGRALRRSRHHNMIRGALVSSAPVAQDAIE